MAPGSYVPLRVCICPVLCSIHICTSPSSIRKRKAEERGRKHADACHNGAQNNRSKYCTGCSGSN
ncbi:hypothetical protein BofuT4_uP147400.1 [Botrytis cinerea T4]|uniref:Uncharacterized protein n=1 Tax=Botryotinia fuckeliana (strain T4) TaxID=999810 RepID=G2YXF9_BOTF4|nr:hypothetical protein BofuT4_uP147400.1 [Botrytis cinerea T4]